MMAAFQEDVQSVLEQFVENVANLPAELAHLFEEMTAKDRKMADIKTIIAQKDASIQRFIKQNGSNVPYAKESNYTAVIQKSYEEVAALQEEKCALSKKALDLITRHIKRLDTKIKDLQTDGLLPNEPIVTPAVLASLQPPTVISHGYSSKLNGSTPRDTPIVASRGPTQNPVASNTPSNPAATTASTPTNASIVSQISSALSTAAGNDAKRRRLTAAGSAISVPVNPSPLGTSNTPTAAVGTPVNRDSMPARTSHTGRKGPPKGAYRRGGPKKRERDEEEDDDVDDSDDDEEEEEAGEDQRPYCTCRQISFGDMVACDDPNCPYEWFHWSCVGLTKEPVGKWYCPHCSKLREKKE